MTDWTFHPTLVTPFYQHLMGANIVNTTPPVERASVLYEFRARASEVTDVQLREMLASTWRASLVGGWFIAYLKRVQFLPLIERMLLTRPMHAQHLCICLARLHGESAVEALLSYMDGCAMGQIFGSAAEAEAITPEWALCALAYLAPDLAATQGRSQWDAFIDGQLEYHKNGYFGRPGKERQLQAILDNWEGRLNRSRGAFSQVMILFDNGLCAH